ncbi:MAG: hypothetical protein BAJATHORv1_20535 [Candidatus Thorarchaeota archaeon]|nr:MAG: hypothetical protein BAJATHORv1_20535 [Candidatus Thorarchaeota archaeon]
MSTEEDTKVSIATPIQTIGTIIFLVKGMYAYSKPGNREDIAEAIQRNHTEVGKSISDAKDMGLITESNGLYSLSDKGREFAILLGHKREDESGKILADSILNSPHWKKIIEFLIEHADSSFHISDLIIFIEKKHSQTWGKGRREKAEKAYRTILEYADLIEIKDGLVYPKISSLSPQTLERGETEKILVETLKIIENHAIFSIPNLISIALKLDKNAISFLREQLKEDSTLHSWMNSIVQTLEKIESE